MLEIRTQPPQHCYDDMVVANEEPVLLDFRRQMAVAQMPCEAEHQRWGRGADLDQRLGRGANENDAAAFQQQTIALAQRHRRFQIKQKSEAVGRDVALPAAEAIVEIERHNMTRCALDPAACRQHTRRAGQIACHQNRK